MTFSTHVARGFGRQQLHDHLPLERRFTRQKEPTHPARSQLALDDIAITKRLREMIL